MTPQEAWKSWKVAESAIDTHTSIELAQMFHFACLIGYAEKAVMLYALVHDVEMPGQPGTPLCDPADIASDLAKTGHLDTLHSLEQAGFDLSPHLDAALAQAAEFGHDAMALYLVQRGADAAALHGHAIAHAAQQRRPDMLNDILDYGRYPQAVLYDLAAQAMKDGRQDILDVLFSHGLDIHQQDEGLLCRALATSHTTLAMLDYLRRNGADPLRADNRPLHSAISNNAVRNTDWVLHEGADPIYLPQAGFDAGMKNKLLGDKLRDAMTHHARVAAQQCDTLNWQQALNAPDADELVVTAVRGGQLRRIIAAMLDQETDMAAAMITAEKLDAPCGARQVTLKELILRTGQHKDLFDPRIWRGRLEEMQRVYGSLPEPVRHDIGTGHLDELKAYDIAQQRRNAMKAKKPFYPGPI